MPKYNTKSPLDKLREKNPKLAYQVAASQELAMKEMNAITGELRIGGKIRYPLLSDDEIHFFMREDMAAYLRSETVLTVKGDDVEEAERFRWWLAQTDRRRFAGMTFEPDLKKAPAGVLNLFTGFAIPTGRMSEGGCSLFYDHLLRNVCRGDQGSYDYLLDILAHYFQWPGRKVGVAPLLYGDKGCGKSIVGEVLAKCIGRRWCFTVDTPEQLTGKHNAYLAKAVLILADEALNSRDARHEARVKHMITGGTMMIEPKNIDAFQIESKANLIFTSNKLNSIATTSGERRVLALHVGNANKQDSDFFGRLMKQMENGGYEALVWDLRNRDISKTDFSRPPMTTQLSVQILDAMTGLNAWWAATLKEGRLPFVRDDDTSDAEWPEMDRKAEKTADLPPGFWTVPKALIQTSAAEFAKDYQGRAPTPAAIGSFLDEVVPGLKRDRRQVYRVRQHIYVLPTLEGCRKAFVAARPGVMIEHVGGPVPGDATPAESGAPPAPAPADPIPRARRQDRFRAVS